MNGVPVVLTNSCQLLHRHPRDRLKGALCSWGLQAQALGESPSQAALYGPWEKGRG